MIAFGMLDIFSFKPELTLRTVLDVFNEGFTFAVTEVVVRFKLNKTYYFIIYNKKISHTVHLLRSKSCSRFCYLDSGFCYCNLSFLISILIILQVTAQVI